MAQVDYLTKDILDIGRHIYRLGIDGVCDNKCYVVYARKDNTYYLYEFDNPDNIVMVEFTGRNAQRYGFLTGTFVIDAVAHQITGEILWFNPVLNEIELP